MITGQPPLPDLSIVIGDFNAVLQSKERSSLTLSNGFHLYCNFLSTTGALDLWILKGHVDLCSEYTHKNYYSGATSIIDCTAIHVDCFFSANIKTLHSFLVTPNHHSIKF